MESSEECPDAVAPAEPQREAVASPVPRLEEGPEAPEGLDLVEAFQVVPPGALFDAVEHTAALGVDRVVYFEKPIAYAQAGKAAAINDS